MGGVTSRNFPFLTAQDFVVDTLGLSLEERGLYAVICTLIIDKGRVDASVGYLGRCARVGRQARLDRLLRILVDRHLIRVEDGFVYHDELTERVTRFEARPPFHIWSRLREQVFQRDGYTCQYCGSTEGPLQCDHVVPVAAGGKAVPENLKTACRSCNRSKGTMSAEEWLGRAAEGSLPRL